MLETELIVGTIGLRQLYADKFPKYSAALLKRSSRVLKDYAEAAKALETQKSTAPMPEDTFDYSDYQELQDLLLGEDIAVEMTEAISSWPSHLQLPLLVQIADVKNYLRDMLPLQSIQGTLSAQPTEPNDSDKFTFLWQANLADNISRFADLFLSGAITPVESAMMRTLFPEANDFFMVLVMEKLVEAVAKDSAQSWEGGWQNPAISALVGVPMTTFAETMTWQTGHQEKTVGRPKGPDSIQLAKIHTTDNQSLDAKTLDLS